MVVEVGKGGGCCRPVRRALVARGGIQLRHQGPLAGSQREGGGPKGWWSDDHLPAGNLIFGPWPSSRVRACWGGGVYEGNRVRERVWDGGRRERAGEECHEDSINAAIRGWSVGGSGGGGVLKMGVERGVLQVRHVGRWVCWSGAGASVFLPYTLYSATLLVHNDQMPDVICCRPWVRTTPPMRASSCVGQTARHSRLDWTHSSTQPLRYATAVLQNFQGRQRAWGIRAGLDPWSMAVLQ